MRAVQLGDVTLHLESPEAGRYQAPILIVPGLFQSYICWRGMTSMLAHRGWEVYLLPRVPNESLESGTIPEDQGWDDAAGAVAAATARLGEKLIVFGADIGASLALTAAESVRPMAMALFAPASGGHVGARLRKDLGYLGRRRLARESGHVQPTTTQARAAYQAGDISGEPRTLVRELIERGGNAENTASAGGAGRPPTIVFAPDGSDSLVGADHALSFADDHTTKASKTLLRGRWWPSLGWEAACEEAHRFLILTLSDRVVEFPDEILADG